LTYQGLCTVETSNREPPSTRKEESTMDKFESLSHTAWDCKCHVVFIPKCRRRTLYGQLRQHLGEVFRKLAAQKESRVEEGHLMPDHVHMMLSIPPKYAASQVGGFHQGQECDSPCKGVRGAQAQLRGAALLGQKVLRLDGRARRSSDPGVHQEPGEGGPETGPTGAVAIDGHRTGGLCNEGPR